jgi:hypothetical protein
VLPDLRWDAPRMARLLAREETLAVSGTVENQGDFYDRFGHVVHLHGPLDVSLARVAARRSNPYGHRAAEQVEIARYYVEVDAWLARSATRWLDGRRPTAELADEVEPLAAA